jgi:segregation and condensation protein B
MTQAVEQLSRIIEGAIFAADHPLTVDQLLALFEEAARPDRALMKDALEQLTNAYEDHGIELKQLASGYQFQVRADLAPWMQRLWEERTPRFSRALMETLAIIAYRQPVTRGEIEDIRGVVVSSQMVRTLMEREWIRVVGHRDVPGRPAMLATTKVFLDYFGLRCLEDLPPLSDVADLEKLGENLHKQMEVNGVEPQIDSHPESDQLSESRDEPVLDAELPDDAVSDDVISDDEITQAETVEQVEEPISDEMTDSSDLIKSDI